MRQEKKLKSLKVFIMLCALCISTFLFGFDAKAATSGTIPCSDGAVTWTLDDNGVLTFHGQGTTKIKDDYGSWGSYWSSVRLNESAVLSVKIDTTDMIYLDDASTMFWEFKNCTSMDLRGFDTSKVTDMGGMFYSCSSLKELNISEFDTSNVENMKHMFTYCSELIQLDVSKFDTSKVTNMRSMFMGCETITELDLSSFKTNKVTNMRAMFCFCYSIIELDLSGFNTSQVTEMHQMFRDCHALTKLDVSGFDVKNVKEMYLMFEDCYSLTELDLSGFDTRNVTNMHQMFTRCYSLTKLDVSGFDTRNVTTMAGMFEFCSGLTELDVSGFDTSNVTNMSEMFQYCSSLTELDLSGFDTSKVTTMSSMFYVCESLTELNVSGFDTSNVTSMTGMFGICTSLKRLDLSNFDTSKLTYKYFHLPNCKELELLITPKTHFQTSLPEIPTDKCWVDTEKNVYKSLTGYTFNEKTEIHRVNASYNITYVTKGKLVDCPTTYKVAEGLSKLGTVNYPDYALKDWYLDAAYTIPVTAIEKGTFGDLKLYGKLIPSTYKITYKNIDGILNQKDLPTTYTYGIELAIPKAEKKCFAFVGWYLDEACTQAFPVITKKTEGDITLYAKWEISHDINRQNGKVVRPATEDETGLVQYMCKNCSYTVTEDIPKIERKPDPTEQAILNNGDDDIKGSSFVLLQARADKTTKNTIRLKWNKVNGADGYFVYGNKCGKKNRYELINTIDNGNTTSFIHKKLKKGTYYKYTIYAYKLANGKREKVAVSKTIHAATKGSKNGNAKSVKVNKTKVTLKPNKTFKIKCKEVAEKGKKIKKHRAVSYESSNTQIATVTKKGLIKARKKGTCYVYAYAQNGVYKKIKVTVK